MGTVCCGIVWFRVLPRELAVVVSVDDNGERDPEGVRGGVWEAFWGCG